MEIQKDFYEDYQKVYYETTITFLNPFKTEIIKNPNENSKIKKNVEKEIQKDIKNKEKKNKKINDLKKDTNNSEKKNNQKKDTKNILINIYKFEYVKNEILLLLSPVYLGDKIPIIKNIERNEYDFTPTFLDIEFMGEKIYEESEFKKMIKIHKNFCKMVFEEIFEYEKMAYIKLLGKFEDKILDGDFLKKNGENIYDVFFKNYLIFPISKDFSDLNLGLEILDFEIKKSQMQKKFEKLKSFEFYKEDENLKNFVVKKKFDKNDFSSTYSIFLCHLGKFKNLTLLDYLKIISNFCYKFNNKNSTKENFINNIKNYFNPSFSNLLNKKISELIVQNFYGIEDRKEMSIFSCFYDLIEKHDNSENINKNQTPEKNAIDFSEEIFFLTLEIPSAKTLDYTIPSIFEKSLNETNPYKMTKSKKTNPKFLKIQISKTHKITGFNSQKINGWYKNLSLLKNFEISIIHRELRLKLDLNYIYFENMSIALTPFSMNSILNYEVFETIGDSILKFIVTVYLILKKQGSEEGELSAMRSNLVSNKYLRKKAILKNLHFFIKMQNRVINDFIPPYFHVNWDFVEKEENLIFFKKFFKEHILGNKSIADVVEALIGAAYFSNKRLCESLFFMKQIGILKNFDLRKFEKVFYEDLEIEDEVLLFMETKEFLDKIHRNVTFKELFYVIKKLEITKTNIDQIYIVDKAKEIQDKTARETYLQKKIQNFQKKNLNYTFKKKSFLLESLKIGTKNFERLEFLGDAVLDIYAIINLHKIAKKLKISLSPEILHCFKVFFLSSDPLSNLTLNFNLLTFLDLSPKKREKIQTYLNSNSENAIKIMWYNKKILAPKVLSDAFEALIGAVFLDTGFEGVKKVLDRVILSFMYFYLIHYKYILLDLKSYVINYFNGKGFKASFERNEEEVFLKVGERVILRREIGEAEVKSLEIGIAVEYLNNKEKYDKIVFGVRDK